MMDKAPNTSYKWFEQWLKMLLLFNNSGDLLTYNWYFGL